MRKENKLKRYFYGVLLILVVVFGYQLNAWSKSGLTYTYIDLAGNQFPDLITDTIIGYPVQYVVKQRDTLLDIARDFGLGINELENLYPKMDPWLPPPGKKMVLPVMWILPPVERTGIVINIAELRLYYFIDGKESAENFRISLQQEHGEHGFPDTRFVQTYPVGIGDEKFKTPPGLYRVIEKRDNPYWYIPPSLHEKYAPLKVVPPGPDNPLGDYWIGIGNSYGIHGTNIPWSIGRLATHGCLRLYPEDIEVLFPSVPVGTPVRIIYEPVKIGFRQGKIYAEIHRDIYKKIDDFHQYGLLKLRDSGFMDAVDLESFKAELKQKSGIPVEVGKILVSRN